MENQLQTFNKYLSNEKTQDYLSEVLGSNKESFVTSLVSLVSNDVKLQECTPKTLMYSAIKSTSLGLPLDNNLGLAYVIPYKNNALKITEAQFQIGYKGFIQLALRTNQFLIINTTDVRQGEIISNDRLTGEKKFKWLDDQIRDKHKIIGYVAYIKLVNGFSKQYYMSKEQADSHGKQYSQSYKSTKKWVKEQSLWTTDFNGMSKKTVLKLLLSKYAPLSVQIREAIKFDQSVIRGDSDIDYIDNKNTKDISFVDFNEIESEIKELLIVIDIDEEDRMHIDMIIEKKETDSYENVLKNLKIRKQRKEMKDGNSKSKLP